MRLSAKMGIIFPIIFISVDSLLDEIVYSLRIQDLNKMMVLYNKLHKDTSFFPLESNGKLMIVMSTPNHCSHNHLSH